MTAREMLRNASNNLYAMADYGGNPKHCAEMETQSRALKALADRLDAEMAAVREGGQKTGKAQMIDPCIRVVLARLDAPLDVDPNTTTQKEP